MFDSVCAHSGKQKTLYSFRNIITFEATGADFYTKGSSLKFGLYLNKVGLPGPAGMILRMADLVTRNGVFSANFAGA